MGSPHQGKRLTRVLVRRQRFDLTRTSRVRQDRLLTVTVHMPSASWLLSQKQRRELNQAIVAYLATNGVADQTIRDVGKILFEDEDQSVMDALKTDGSQSADSANVLERKWTTVLRLQKKVLDLQAQVTSLKHELDAGPGSLSRQKSDPTNWLPHSPSKYTFTGHRGVVNAVAFHPKFSVLASCSEDGTIKIWDWELGELEKTIKAHTKEVLDVDFSALYLASCSSDLTIKLWDPTSEYDNTKILTGHDHTISSVRFVSSGSHLISASRDKSIRIWEVKTGYCTRTILGHLDWVKCVAPSLDGQYILSAGRDHTARIASMATGETRLVFSGHENVIDTVAIAPPEASEYLHSIQGYDSAPPPLSGLGQSFEYVATGSRDKTIKIWSCRGELVVTLVGHDNWVRGLAFHPAGKYLLSVADDKTIRCWDLSQQGRCVKTIKDAHDHFVTCLRWAPSGDNNSLRCVIATGSVEKDVRIWG